MRGASRGRSRPGGRWPRRPPWCQASRASRRLGVRLELVERVHAVRHHPQQRRLVAGVDLGVERPVEVLGGQREPQPTGVGAVLAVVVSVGAPVHHDGRQLGVVRPRPAVEVVGADRGPDVVDDAGLRVHVDGGALVVLDAVERHPPRSGGHHLPHRPPPSEQLGRPGGAAEVGVHRDDREHVQARLAAQRVGEHVPDVVAPQVLVLHVDQAPGLGQRLGVAAGDAALAATGERVVASVPQVGVGPQQLHDVRAALDRRGRRRLVGQRVGRQVHVPQPVPDDEDGVAAQRGRVLPALPEHGLDVVDRRALDRDLDVVPGRRRAVLLGHLERLRVALVVGVVPPRVAQVDAADERDVPRRVVAVPDHHELLVVRAAGAHPHVQQRLGAALLQRAPEPPVLRRGEPELLPVRAPDEAADVDAALVGAAEHVGHLAAGLAGEPFVGVALPVGEEHQVARPGRLETLMELGEVGRSVDQGPDQVALRPRRTPRVPGIEGGGAVAAFALVQQPHGRVGAFRCAHPPSMPRRTVTRRAACPTVPGRC